MRKKKFKNSLEAIRTIESMPTQQTASTYTGKSGLRQFQDAEAARIADEERKRKEEAERPALQAQAELNANLLKLRDAESERVKAFWSQDLKTISTLGLTHAPVDKWLNVETAATRASDAAIFTAYKTFRLDIESRGVILSEDSWSKLGSYLQAASFHSQASLAVTSTWRDGLIRLSTLGCVISEKGDPLTLIQAQVEPRTEPQPQTPRPDLDTTLRTVSGETREGRAELLAAVHDSIKLEALDAFDAFYRVIIDTFNYRLTPNDVKVIANRMAKRPDLPFQKLSSWSDATAWACQRGLLSNNELLTADQRVCIAIENDPRSTTDYQARVDTAKMIGRLVHA
jgi:hypothetical protein